MSSKEMLCNGCGRWREDGSYVDCGDGDGVLWTCPDCVSRLNYLEKVNAALDYLSAEAKTVSTLEAATICLRTIKILEGDL